MVEVLPNGFPESAGFVIIPVEDARVISTSSPKNLLTLLSSTTLPVLIKMLGRLVVIASKSVLSAAPCQILKEIGTYL